MKWKSLCVLVPWCCPQYNMHSYWYRGSKATEKLQKSTSNFPKQCRPNQRVNISPNHSHTKDSIKDNDGDEDDSFPTSWYTFQRNSSQQPKPINIVVAEDNKTGKSKKKKRNGNAPKVRKHFKFPTMILLDYTI